MVTLSYIPSVTIFEKGYVNNKGVAVVQTRVRNLQVPLTHVYNYIRTRAKNETLALRAESDKNKQAQMKMLNFLSCTPAGTFWYRDSKFIICRSGMMVIDIDDLSQEQVPELKQALIHDQRYETELLFTSPRGFGLKWFIGCGQIEGTRFQEFFNEVSLHVRFQYGVPVDESGKDFARCCFLSWDDSCYINPNFINS